ncbi:restriction endonuclease subunit S [Actinobacillus pleuropneumoniae]|uniref:restriction endonuclease subunit S n=1 Tax=Actinobacillus pleuropneumoniae TaxID=715 RepID=UPI003B023C5B
MNILELIKDCEVEWKSLGEVATLQRGRVISKTYLEENKGDFPVYSSQTQNNGEIGKINTYDFDGEFVNWTTDGANAGTVFYRKGKFSITNVSGLIVIKNQDLLNYKFLYYWLLIEAKKHVYSGMGNPKLMSHQMEKIRIPIPSLEIQEKIVKTLDIFTELEATLEAELSLRVKQYDYYRNELLTFGDDVEWKTLGEVGELIRGNGLQKKDFTEVGVPAIHYGQIYTYYGNETKETISFVSEELAKKLKKVNKGDVVITNTSENIDDVGKALLYSGEIQAVTGGHATIFKPNYEIILGKYFVYFTQSLSFENQKRKLAKGTKVIDVSATDMNKIKIPIPPLATQQKIVEILDKFDRLTNSISDGLPKEIELRSKQYEYYREQLLNFSKSE